MTDREKLVRLAATPVVQLTTEEARFLADWVQNADPEELEDLLDESARVHQEIRRRGL